MNKNFALALVLTAATVLPFGIALPSLSHVADALNVPYDYVYHTIVVYLFVSAFVSLLFGIWVDYFGKRTTLLVALAIFLCSTLGCALATNIYWYFCFRVLQAIVVGAFTVSLMLVRENYDKNILTLKLNQTSLAYAVTPIIASILGGFIDEWLGWRAVFWVLLVIYIGVFMMVVKLLEDDTPKNKSSLAELLSDYVSIFSISRFWHYTLTNALCMSVFFIFIASAPAFLANSNNLTSTQIGMMMAFPPLGFVLSCLFSEKILAAYSCHQKISFGRVVVFLGLTIGVGLHYAAINEVINIMLCGFFIGVGNGISTPNIKSALVSIHSKMLGAMIGLFTFVSSLLGAIISASYSFFNIDYQQIVSLYWVLLIPAVLGLVAAFFILLFEQSPRQ